MYEPTGNREETMQPHPTPIEVTCDESGSEGEKLIGATTEVFAHAGVHLDTETAAECIQEMRDRIRSPALEYKANHLQREKNRPVLVWLLKSSRPILANSHVYLVDKAYYVLGKLADVLLGPAPDDIGLNQDGQVRDTLFGAGGRAFPAGLWRAFLTAANGLMRANNRLATGLAVDSFFHVTGVLHETADGPVRDILGSLLAARPRAEAFRARLRDNPTTTVDPLIPAIAHAVAYWGQGVRPVSIVHDRQTALSEDRVAQLKQLLSGGLDSLTFADSRTDPRVQLADILAGVVRKIAEDELTGRGDPELTALLLPYVDESSIWGDRRSWSLIRQTGPT